MTNHFDITHGEQRLHLKGLRFDANLGILDREKQAPQPIQVDAELNLGVQPLHPRDDDILHVLDYRKVREIIIDECTAEHVNLLESLIGKLCQRLLGLHGVCGVRVKITKLEIFDDCDVAIHMEAGDWQLDKWEGARITRNHGVSTPAKKGDSDMLDKKRVPLESGEFATSGRTHGTSRRRFLQSTGMVGVAAAIGAPMVITSKSARAADKTLKILQWSHFVPSYDTWFDSFAKTWGEANGVKVVVDHINLADLVTTTTSEISANSGHDLIELVDNASQFSPSVLDMADINQEAEKQFGKPFKIIPRLTYNPVVKQWYAFCHGWTIDPGNYRHSMWGKAGMPDGPDTWEQLLTVGEKIRQDQGVQMGIGMSQELDSNMVSRSLLWSFGATIQDANDNVILGQGDNRARAIEAVKYMVDLYKRTMTPAVFSWNAASNNQDLIAGKASYIVNSISAYRSAQESVPDVARDIAFCKPLAGPRGDRWSNPHVLYSYIIPKFAKSREDLAKQFVMHLAKNYDQAMYYSKLYNSPSFYGTTIPDGDRGKAAVAGAKTLQDLNDTWFAKDPFALDGEPAGKLEPLTTATDWTTNLGHPGYSNPAVGEVFNTFVMPNMMAKAARGTLTPEQAVDEAAKQCATIYAQWRKRGLIGGKS